MQWCQTRQRQQLLTPDPDPLCRNAFKVGMLSLYNFVVGRMLTRPMRTGPRSGVTIGTVTEPSEWHEGERSYDSGSQSTACGVQFAKDYKTDDTGREPSCGTFRTKRRAAIKLSMCCSTRQAHENPIPANIKVDVSDVARNVASTERVLKAVFDLHFTIFGHACWMQNGRQETAINEDSPTSAALLHNLEVEVLPPPCELGNGTSSVGARVWGLLKLGFKLRFGKPHRQAPNVGRRAPVHAHCRSNCGSESAPKHDRGARREGHVP